MTTTRNVRREQANRAQAGVAIIAVLLFVGVIGLMSATYLRKVILDYGNSPLSRPILDATESAHSGAQWGRQVVRSGWDASSTIVGSGGSAATVQVAPLANEHFSIVSGAVDSDGLGATFRVELAALREPLADHPDTMPRLTPEAVERLLDDPTVPKIHVSGTQTFANQDLYGLVIVEQYGTLMLNDVTLQGTIVSEGVLGDDPFGDFDPISAPAVVISGPLRIEPASFLPGVAVLMPDGVMRDWSSPVQAQIGGDLLAHTILMSSTTGSLLGHVLSVLPASLHPNVIQTGTGRTPQPWSDDLDVGGTSAVRWMAYVPRSTGAADVSAISEYAFP